jgi:phage repressor protein C with HTH and peptisase S24 domain
MFVNMNSEPEDSSEQEEDTFRGRLRLLALRVGSVTALAKAAGIPQSTIRRYFDKSDPPLPALPKLARAGNVSLAWFITGEGPMQIEEENAYIRIGSFLWKADRITLQKSTKKGQIRISYFALSGCDSNSPHNPQRNSSAYSWFKNTAWSRRSMWAM